MGDGVKQSCCPLSKLGFGDRTQSLSAHPSSACGVAMGSEDALIPPVFLCLPWNRFPKRFERILHSSAVRQCQPCPQP